MEKLRQRVERANRAYKVTSKTKFEFREKPLPQQNDPSKVVEQEVKEQGEKTQSQFNQTLNKTFHDTQKSSLMPAAVQPNVGTHQFKYVERDEF